MLQKAMLVMVLGGITSDSIKGETYTEYIANRLTESLKKKNYCISYDVNTGVNPYFRRAQLPYTVYAVTNKTGVFFSKEHPIEYTYSVYSREPQVWLTSDQNQYLEDTLNWEHVEGFYKAEGDEAYITIGNFVPIADLALHVKPVNMTPQQLADYTGGAECYQYIDNVELIEIPKLVVTADTVLRGSDGLVIDCSTPADAYEWFKGDTLTPVGNSDSILVNPQEQTTYYLKATQCKLVTWDTVRVYITGIAEPKPALEVSLLNTLTAESFKINYTGSYKPLLNAELYNGVGQLVRKFSVAQSMEVPVSDLAAGIYYCKLSREGTPVLMEKVVKVN